MNPVSAQAAQIVHSSEEPQVPSSRCAKLVEGLLSCCLQKPEKKLAPVKEVVLIDPSPPVPPTPISFKEVLPPAPMIEEKRREPVQEEAKEESFVEVVETYYCRANGVKSLSPPEEPPLSTLFLNLQKGWNYAALISRETTSNETFNHLTSDVAEWELLNALLNSETQLLSNVALIRYIQFLEKRYQRDGSVSFFAEGILSHSYIEGRDPKSVILKKIESAKQLIVYPFIWPPNTYLGIQSYPHIVLVVVDQKERQIFYYDSQGVTSRQKSKPNLFSDNPKFNMSDNLQELAEALRKRDQKNRKILENIERHQTDPVQCGVYILSKLESLYQTLNPMKIFDVVPQSACLLRRALGGVYKESLVKKSF